jgi:CBS domain containing-hemolysin-like protein
MQQIIAELGGEAMKTTDRQYNWLFRLSFKVLKYASLALVGLTVASVLSAAFGAVALVEAFMMLLLPWIARVAIVIFFMVSSGAIAESLR